MTFILKNFYHEQGVFVYSRKAKCILLVFNVCVFCLYAYVCTTCMPGALQIQKWASDLLEVEL